MIPTPGKKRETWGTGPGMIKNKNAERIPCDSRRGANGNGVLRFAQHDSIEGQSRAQDFRGPHRREIGTGLVSFACGANVPVPGFCLPLLPLQSRRVADKLRVERHSARLTSRVRRFDGEWDDVRREFWEGARVLVLPALPREPVGRRPAPKSNARLH